jgi:hypothetical protein
VTEVAYQHADEFEGVCGPCKDASFVPSEEPATWMGRIAQARRGSVEPCIDPQPSRRRAGTCDNCGHAIEEVEPCVGC